MFGNEKNDSFKSSLETIYQTFGGKELYPSIEEKAVNLLYFIVKNHSFSDGDKKAGVVWNMQGSGKSLSMVFYAGKIVLALNNPTVLVITDHNDLDDPEVSAGTRQCV